MARLVRMCPRHHTPQRSRAAGSQSRSCKSGGTIFGTIFPHANRATRDTARPVMRSAAKPKPDLKNVPNVEAGQICISSSVPHALELWFKQNARGVFNRYFPTTDSRLRRHHAAPRSFLILLSGQGHDHAQSRHRLELISSKRDLTTAQAQPVSIRDSDNRVERVQGCKYDALLMAEKAAPL